MENNEFINEISDIAKLYFEDRGHTPKNQQEALDILKKDLELNDLNDFEASLNEYIDENNNIKKIKITSQYPYVAFLPRIWSQLDLDEKIKATQMAYNDMFKRKVDFKCDKPEFKVYFPYIYSKAEKFENGIYDKNENSISIAFDLVFNSYYDYLDYINDYDIADTMIEYNEPYDSFSSYTPAPVYTNEAESTPFLILKTLSNQINFFIQNKLKDKLNDKNININKGKYAVLPQKVYFEDIRKFYLIKDLIDCCEYNSEESIHIKKQNDSLRRKIKADKENHTLLNYDKILKIIDDEDMMYARVKKLKDNIEWKTFTENLDFISTLFENGILEGEFYGNDNSPLKLISNENSIKVILDEKYTYNFDKNLLMELSKIGFLNNVSNLLLEDYNELQMDTYCIKYILDLFDNKCLKQEVSEDMLKKANKYYENRSELLNSKSEKYSKLEVFADEDKELDY